MNPYDIPTTKNIGNAAEDKALRFLQKKGLSLIMRNYQIKAGEIDLIMQDHDDIVFIEVKCRQTESYGTPSEFVMKEKKRRLIRAATHFLVERNQYHSAYCRFDVIGISNNKINWIKNAFGVDG